MDVYDNRALTGQMGMHPLLIVWDLDTMRLLVIYIIILFIVPMERLAIEWYIPLHLL